jgi:hypothetical protein
MHLTEKSDRLTQLQEQLFRAKKAREHHALCASEAQDDSYAAATEYQRMALVSAARGHRAHAGRYAETVRDLSREIAALEAPVVPVVLCRDAVEGMDDMMACGVLS